MGRYNLLREPWIEVITLSTGRQKAISMQELFLHAEKYKTFAGDMETQDFSLLRFLVSVLHTVFSRYDSEGKPYFFIKLDEKMRQTEAVDEDDIEEYISELEESWKQIWERRCFPEILYQYLEEWSDHFYLFDSKYPFYQCTENEINSYLPSGKKMSPVAGRFINRMVSESGNKKALFSPEAEIVKDQMSEAELARWLIMLQGYIGLSDKTKLYNTDLKSSKGWLFDLGGLYLKGNNLFETLMLNYIPVHSLRQYTGQIQAPCWELDNKQVLNRLIQVKEINNISELYTNWSRAVFIDPLTDMSKAISIGIAKLPAIRHADQFLEPMSTWRYNLSGDMKNHFTPRKHMPEQKMWRSFGLIAMNSSSQEHQHRPEILKQYDRVKKVVGNRNIALCAVSMRDDGSAMSWVPTDEIIDSLFLNDIVISDDRKDGWVIRITSIVEETKKIVEVEYGSFLKDMAEIRGFDLKNGYQAQQYISNRKKEMYLKIDLPFKNWIESISPKDLMEERILQWRKERRLIIDKQLETILDQAGGRDYRGIIKKDGTFVNIVTAYLGFKMRMKMYS